jgi:predicted double-glycine peptidase
VEIKKSAAQAKQDLIRSIKERDQEMKKASATLSQTADTNKELVSLEMERNELTTVFKQMEKRLRGLEDSWEKEDEGKQKQLAKETEERKRKAAEQIDEQQKKRQRIEECEMSDIQRLEQELSEKAKELDTLKQTQSQMIWLVKQVITIQEIK